VNKTKTLSWVAPTGNSVTITMVAQFGLDLQGRRKNAGRMQVDVDTCIDGVSLGGMAHLSPMDHATYVAKISNGRKGCGLTRENLHRYNVALAELEDLIADHNAELDRQEDEYDAVEEDRLRIERTMAYGE
jgi:hypothetical protein